MGNKSPSIHQAHVKLTRNDIDLILANTDSTEQEIYQWHRQFLRMAPDGKLDLESFIEFYKCCNPGLHIDAMAKLVFLNLDKDHSGYISFLEFFIPNCIYKKGDPKTRAKLVFDICDINKNGSITSTELSEVLEALYQMRGVNIKSGPDCASSKAKTMINNLDFNHDRKIQKSEFVYSMLMDRETADILAFDFGFSVPCIDGHHHHMGY